MDRGELEKILTCFQASARGYLIRNEIRQAREDFEDVVREIDGSLTHLEWRETFIPIPRFSDTDGPLRPCSSARRLSKPELDVYSGFQTQLTATAPSSSVEIRDHPTVREKTEAERDDSQIKTHASLSTDCLSNRNIRGAVEGQKESTVEDKDGGVMYSTGESTTAWSSLELDMSYGLSLKGSRQHCLAQEVPCTPEALRLHRNTLTMELLWLQQAIDSRKKYLSLKDRLSVS